MRFAGSCPHQRRPARASPAGQLEARITDAAGLALGLMLSHGLERGAILEVSAMSRKWPLSICDSSPARSGMGETDGASPRHSGD
jgi:hypothetical protein